VKKNRVTSLATLSDNILAEVEASERVKVAEAEAVKAATPDTRSEIVQLLHKVATEVRSTPADITYGDLENFLQAGAR